jgi:hypothetical protein
MTALLAHQLQQQLTRLLYQRQSQLRQVSILHFRNDHQTGYLNTADSTSIICGSVKNIGYLSLDFIHTFELMINGNRKVVAIVQSTRIA